MMKTLQLRYMITIMLAIAAFSQAGIIATNQNVPASMDNNTGTALDMAEYLFYDGYSTTFTNTSAVAIGYNNDYVQLTVSEGSELIRIDGDKKLYLGRKAGTFGNKLKITGSNSTVRLGPLSSDNSYWFQLGFTGSSDNTLEVLDGGKFITSGYLNMYAASNPVIRLDNNASFYTYYRGYIGTAYGTKGAEISIRNGSVFTVVSRLYLNAGRRSSVTINGFGSKFISGGSFQYQGTNCFVSVEDDALVKINSSTCLPTDPSSFYGFADGFLAIKTATIDPTVHVKLWDGSAWIQPADLAEATSLGWSVTNYTTDAEAEIATGYDGLANYTICTGGLPMDSTPPDSEDKGTLITIH